MPETSEISEPLHDLPVVPSSPTLPEIVQRYLNGESLQTLAAECGITKQGLHKRIKVWSLSGEGDKDYEGLVRTALIHRTEESYEELDSALTAVDITRASAKLRYNQFIMERRLPKLFGIKQQDTNEKVIVIVNRSNDGPNTQTIDVSPQQITDGN